MLALLALLSNFKIRHDVTQGRLRIPGELPLNAHVVYGFTAKHARCMVTRLKYAVYTACDITSNLEVGQRVVEPFTMVENIT